jgi:hypothetical protein
MFAIFSAASLGSGLWTGAIENLGRGEDSTYTFTDQPVMYCFWLATYLAMVLLFGGMSRLFVRQALGRI